MKKIFLSCWAVLFCLLIGVQGYTAWDLHREELAAEELAARAAEEIGGMEIYLTFETEGNVPSHGVLCLNGDEVGNFRHGILTVAVTEGDIPAVKNAVGETFCIVDYPADLDRNALPETLFCDQTVTKWGKISFE